MKNGRFLLLFVVLIAAFCVFAQDHVESKENMFTGNASFYSDKLHGRRMSNGEKYHRDSFTCAHLKFPLGTLLKVRNPLNDKECIVKVTDRGPHTKRFIIDLSRAAAQHLGIIYSGFAQVEITPFHPAKVPFKLDAEDFEIPELDMNYVPAATFPDPAWQKDSINYRKLKISHK